MGPDDATNDVSSALDGTFAPFEGDAALQSQIGARLVEHWAPFAVDIVNVRPRSGDYTMVVVTPTNPVVGAANLGPLDCGNRDSHNVVFGFTDQKPDVDALAAYISAAVGFGLGVAVSTGTGLSGNGSLSANASWLDECVPLAGVGDCGQSPHCDSANEQNPYQVILDAVGTA